MGKMGGAAVISQCRKYRYVLTREWKEDIKYFDRITFVMLNPSTAEANIDDPTIRKCIKFAMREHMGELRVVNLFAYRATDPKKLLSLSIDEASGGDKNAEWIAHSVLNSCLIVVAWGNHGKIGEHLFFDRLERVGFKGNLYCLGINKNGTPKHPLYCRDDSPLIRYERSHQ